MILAQSGTRTIDLEFLATVDEENLEDHLAYLSEQTADVEESEFSFRLLRHHAHSVRHQKYHGMDVVKVQIQGTRLATV